MIDKRPIDKKRDSGGSAEIGTEEDGAIVEMFNLNDKLIIIKEKSIYEYITADSIDPERTNIGLPNSIQRLVINQGADSEMVSRTFLTAKTLFKSEFFDETIDSTKALTLSLDILQELAVLEEEINDYLTKEQNVSEEYDKKRKTLGSYAIPSISNVETTCKSIFQKANNIEQLLMEIIIIFYPKSGLTKQSHYPTFYGVLKNKYGEQDAFSEFISDTLVFMKIVRSLRNSLDHRLGFAKVMNFELQVDSNIISPTIELNHKGDKLEKVSISYFLPLVLQNFIAIFERTIVYLSDRNAKSNFMNYRVYEIPEEKRRFKFVKYSFWSALGQDGFFHQ